MTKRAFISIAVACSLGVGAAASQAAAVMSFQQIGSDVVGTLTGSLNLTGMTASPGYTSIFTGIVASAGALFTGPVGSAQTGYLDQLAGPVSWGAGGQIDASPSIGDAIVVAPTVSTLWVPDGYASGDALNATMTFANETFVGLGALAGDYVYTLSSSDTLTVRFANAVPLPGTVPLLFAGLAGLAIARRRRI